MILECENFNMYGIIIHLVILYYISGHLVLIDIFLMLLFISTSLMYLAGLKELSPLPLNLKRLYKETLDIEPILIIISPGADPSQELQELANAERSGECYHQVSTFYPADLLQPLLFLPYLILSVKQTMFCGNNPYNVPQITSTS